MALGKSRLTFLLMLAFFGVCFGAVYRVGDSNGWTSRGLVDYNEWASTKDFYVNDTLIFTYNNQFHNVMQVTNQDFESCNPTSPVAVYTSGSDTITLERHGNFYFMCGAPGHCQAGQGLRSRPPYLHQMTHLQVQARHLMDHHLQPLILKCFRQAQP
ncbi:unnamed protein product [Prunus armeniaca]|uniref:Phytocyanin domain-containing protein n=1 Tax=Prunus armeniaca TaxID=36596 RepID=A0A6J5UMM3_PRUAR|nr:unnamed protein product [Prunus armeniaca]